MGTLANSLFQTLLGWIRTLSSEVWSTASSPESATLFRWVGENWKMLALVLCAIGLVTDLMVYLFRWQPWRAWRGFFRRLRHREEDAGEPEETEGSGLDAGSRAVRVAPLSSDPAAVNRREDSFLREESLRDERERTDSGGAWDGDERTDVRIYARSPYARTPEPILDRDVDDGTREMDSPRKAYPEASGAPSLQGALMDSQGRTSSRNAYDHEMERPSPQNSRGRRGNYAPAFSEDVPPPDLDEPVRENAVREPLTWQRTEPGGTTASFEQAIRPRRRRVTRFFTDQEEETVTPDQLIDQYAAYRRPVYPRSWNAEENGEQ